MNAMLKPSQPLSGGGDQSTALLRQSALAARERGNLRLAKILYREILCRYPDDAEAAEALQLPSSARVEAAILAIPIRPDPSVQLPALMQRARALHESGRDNEALVVCERAIAATPRNAESYVLRGTIQRDLGSFEDSLESFQTALTQSDNSHAKVALGCLHLLLGDFDKGWPLVEQNVLPQKGESRSPDRESLWLTRDSEALRGKVLHLHQDQGVAGTLQFARYARLAEERGAIVVLSVQDHLRGLLQSLSPAITVISETQACRAFDYQCSISALPGIFGTTRETIPAETRYLLAEGARSHRWSGRLGAEGFKIGVCWLAVGEGSDKRSIPLHLLESISKLPGVRLISLQAAGDISPLAALPAGMNVESFADLDAGPEALLEAAAIIECLDLVITCDSAIAHLAGALGAQTWVVLPRVPDWCWMLERRDSPWYPTLRLFRQSADSDYGAVIEAMSMELETLLDARPAQPASPVLDTAATLAGTQLPDGTPFSESPVPIARDEAVARFISRSSPALPLPALLSAPKLVSGVLVALLCAEVVNMARAVLPHQVPPAPTDLPASSSRAEIDVNPIVAAHLFGQTAGAPVLASAPPAASDLTLTATLATSDPARGLAIIGEDGKSNVYSVGRAIADVSLQAVYADRVVIERNGRSESLYLPRKNLDQAGVLTTVAATRPSASPGPSAASEPATAIDKYLDSFVVTDNFGNLVGIRVVPGRDRAGFARSGLAGGDVVVAMNGLSDGVADSWKQAANGTTVTVLRRGVRRDITLNFPD